MHILIFYLLCGGYSDDSGLSECHSVSLTHNLTLFTWGQNLVSSINSVFTGISTRGLLFLFCWISNVAWVGWRQLIILLNLKLFEQAVSKLQYWWGREKGILWIFFGAFPPPPPSFVLAYQSNKLSFQVLEFYVKSGKLYYIASNRLLNQIESSGYWKTCLESDWAMNFGIACQSPAYSWGKQPILMFPRSPISSWFSHRGYREHSRGRAESIQWQGWWGWPLYGTQRFNEQKGSLLEFTFHSLLGTYI